MAKFTKYLSICVILASSTITGAMKFPIEDCDDGKDNLASSGSAHSSQFMMPDGSVLTNSRGGSVSSDGIHRTFHELKKEANKYVSKSSDGLIIPSIPIIPEIPGAHFSPFFNKNSFASGQQSSFSSSQSGSSGSSQYVDEQQYPQAPAESKVSTFKQTEVKKRVVTKSSSGSDLSGDIDVHGQIQGENSNIHNYGYRPIVPTTVQKGYESSHRQESEKLEEFDSSVNPVPSSIHKTVIHYTVPSDTQGFYESQSNKASQSFKTSGSSIHIPTTYEETKVDSLIPDSGSSSSLQSHKFESYSRQDANAGIPSYLVNIKPNTFTTNVVSLDKSNDQTGSFVPSLTPGGQKPSELYTSESHSERAEQKETKQIAVPILPKVPNHTKDTEEIESLRPEELESYGIKPVDGSQKYILYPSGSGPRTRFQIKVQAPETVGTSQSYKKESHSQSIKQTVSSDLAAPGAWLPATAAGETELDTHVNYAVRPVSLSAVALKTHEEQASTEKSVDAIQIPILLPSVPQNTGYSQSSSSQLFSAGSSSKSTGGSQIFTFPGETTDFSSASFHGSVDKFGIPIKTYVAPQSVSKSSSSSGYHYFSSNGQAGEQLVPNSSIFANAADSSSLHQSHASLLQKLNANAGSELDLASGPTGQKKTYGFSTAYSSHSSNINGKVTENREASVAVNDNGKIDSYHVKS